MNDSTKYKKLKKHIENHLNDLTEYIEYLELQDTKDSDSYDFLSLSPDYDWSDVGYGNTAIDGYVSAEFPEDNYYAADTVSLDFMGGGEDSISFNVNDE